MINISERDMQELALTFKILAKLEAPPDFYHPDIHKWMNDYENFDPMKNTKEDIEQLKLKGIVLFEKYEKGNLPLVKSDRFRTSKKKSSKAKRKVKKCRCK